MDTIKGLGKSSISGVPLVNTSLLSYATYPNPSRCFITLNLFTNILSD